MNPTTPATLYSVMAESPWLTFFLLCALIQGVYKCVNRFIRGFTLRKHGYPPPHCDFRDKEEEFES